LPENGIFAVLEALPVKGPWTWTDGLIVSTLVVVPAMGDSTAVTDPFRPERPERGSGLACVICDMPDRDVTKKVPIQRIAAAPPIRQIGVFFLFP